MNKRSAAKRLQGGGSLEDVKRATEPSGPRTVWLYKGQLLVACIKEGAGHLLPTRHASAPTSPPPADALQPDAPAHPWAGGQCYSQEWQEDVERGLADCKSFDEFLKRMKYYKYRIENAEPSLRRKPFYRL